jgi:RimJ/RimL family protein N-acetyltransferase
MNDEQSKSKRMKLTTNEKETTTVTPRKTDERPPSSIRPNQTANISTTPSLSSSTSNNEHLSIGTLNLHCIFPPRQSLVGRYVTLHPVDAVRDTADLFACSHDKAVVRTLFRYMTFGPFESETKMREWLEMEQSATNRVVFTVYLNKTNKPIGMCSYLNVEPSHARLEIGAIWYSPEVVRD